MLRFAVFCGLSAVSLAVAAQTPVTLITFADMEPSQSPPGEFLQTWNAGFNTVSLRTGISAVTLNLPDGTNETIDLVNFEARDGYLDVDTDGDGDTEVVLDPNASDEDFSWRWYGRSSGWTVALTLEKGVLAGRITSANSRYGVVPRNGGLYTLGLVNSQYWQLHEGDTDKGVAGSQFGHVAERKLAGESDLVPMAWDESCSMPLSSTRRFVDVLVIYETDMVTPSRPAEAVRALIRSAFDDANEALRNTDIHNMRYVLRGIEASTDGIDYSALTIAAALEQFGGWRSAGGTINFIPNSVVAAKRNTYEADIVALAREANDSTCGAAFIQHTRTSGYIREPGPDFEPFSYLVFNPLCNVDRLNFAHELGHLLGMEHDPRNASTATSASVSKSCPWSFAHRRRGSTTDPLRFRTLMAYWEDGNASLSVPQFGEGCGSSNGCPLIDAYSNPVLEWNGSAIFPSGTWPGAPPIGVPMPHSRAAIAADTLPRLATIVEAFRNRSDLIFSDTFQ